MPCGGSLRPHRGAATDRSPRRIGAPFEHAGTLAEKKIAEAAQLERELGQEGQETPPDDTLVAVKQGKDLENGTQETAGKPDLAPEAGEVGESFSSSSQSRVPPHAKPAGLPVEEVQRIVDDFRARLRLGENRLDFRVFQSQEQAFGPQGSIEKVGRLKVAYLPASRTVGLVAGHLSSAREAEETLRHEVLAHFGLNLFTLEEKRSLLDAISGSRKVSSLKPVWEEIDARYADKNESYRAEEVFARIAEQKPSRLGG